MVLFLTTPFEVYAQYEQLTFCILGGAITNGSNVNVPLTRSKKDVPSSTATMLDKSCSAVQTTLPPPYIYTENWNNSRIIPAGFHCV